jgi:glycosyltransferase involved in cell wall biosynthesis
MSNEGKKILVVTPFYPPAIGGISNLTYNLTKELASLNNEVDVITSESILKVKSQKSIQKNLTAVKSIFMPGWPYPTLRSFSIPIDLGLKIQKMIKKNNYDVIHIHGHHYPLCWLAASVADRNDVPLVLSLHGMYALNPKKLGGSSRLEEIFNRSIFSNLLSKCNVVIGGTFQIIGYAEKYGKTSTRYVTIPNGVNTLKFQNNLHRKKEYRGKYNVPQDSIVILFIGRFEQVKGILEFCQAIKILVQENKKIEVIIVGEGSLTARMKKEISGLYNVKILGWQSSVNIHEIYIMSDIFVLPSKFEALPLTIIEAMSARLHIIFSDVGGVAEILGKYSKKTKLSEVTPHEVYSKISDVISNGISDDLDESSLMYIRTFDWNFIAKEIRDVYSEVRK